MAKKLRCKDMVGRKARVTRGFETQGGTKFEEGEVVVITGTWRGQFQISRSGKVGYPDRRGNSARQVPRHLFELIEE